jgi:glycosyltransferase involved in cell wall biosynthesis
VSLSTDVENRDQLQAASGRPKVSIGMPIYNEERFLREAIDSLLAQDYTDFELIICDNASQDATEAICREYAARDPRIRYHRNETNVGANENFNRAFRFSCGEYFMFASGHDLWAPTYLSRCVEVLESDATVVHCNSVAQRMSQDGKEFGRTFRQIDTRRFGPCVRAILVHWQVFCFLSYAVMRSSAMRQTRLSVPGVLAPDHIFGYELALLGPTAIVAEPLFFMRDNRGEGSRPINRVQAKAAFVERLYPGEKNPFGRFWKMRGTFEVLRAIRRAPILWGQRVLLIGSIPFALVMGFYRYLPEVIRSPVRRLLDRRSNLPHN